MATAAKYKVYNGSEWVELTFTPSSHTHDDYAKKASGVYFVEGTQTAATNVWTGSNSDITELYDGLTIKYYLPYAGTSTGATLNINSLGAYPVYRYGRSTQITTHFSAGSMITLTFRTNYAVSGTSYTNAWLVDNFYDSNSYAYVRQYTTTTDAAYPLLFAYDTSLPSSYDTKYTRKSSYLTFNPSTKALAVDGTIYENGTALSNKYSKKAYGIYFVDGSDSTTAGTWIGTNSDISSYYDGLVINYKIGVAGASTTTLNINSLGAKTCYLRGTTALTTHYAVGTMVILSYNATTDAFYAADYDANTKNTVGSSNTSSKIFLVGTTSQTSSATSYSHDTCYIGTDGCLYSNSTKVSVEGHTHSYLPSSGGSLTGNLSIAGGNIVIAHGNGYLQTNKILVPTASGDSTYGAGSAGQVLTSNGSNCYWATPSSGGKLYRHNIKLGYGSGYLCFTVYSSSSSALISATGSASNVAFTTYPSIFAPASTTACTYVYQGSTYYIGAFFMSLDGATMYFRGETTSGTANTFSTTTFNAYYGVTSETITEV